MTTVQRGRYPAGRCSESTILRARGASIHLDSAVTGRINALNDSRTQARARAGTAASIARDEVHPWGAYRHGRFLKRLPVGPVVTTTTRAVDVVTSGANDAVRLRDRNRS